MNAPVFHFHVIKSITELGAARGQDLIYRPTGDIARLKLLTLLPDQRDAYYERMVLRHWHRLRLTGQTPAATDRSAYEYLRSAVHLRDSA